jgi:hypothetical protein
VTRDGVPELWHTIRQAAASHPLAFQPGAPENLTDV